MKQRMRRISALLLVVLMCVSMVIPAFAADSAECPAIHTKSNCSYGDPIATVEADCGQQGYTVYQCKDCGTYFAADFVESLGDHEYSILYKNPTCTENGYYKVVCFNCDEVIYEEIETYTGHTMAGPCDNQVCEVCGYVGEAEDNDHNWGEPTLKKAPVHTEKTNGQITVTEGSAEVKCLDCGKTKTVPVSCVAAHTWVEYAQVDATCTTTGTTAGKKCSGCGKTAKVDGQTTEPFATIDKIACEAEDLPTVTAPDCENGGTFYFACTMCEKPVDDVITLAPLGHNFQTRIYELDENGLTPVELVLYEAIAVFGVEIFEEDEAPAEFLAYEIKVLAENADGEFVLQTLSVEEALALISRAGFETYVAGSDKYVWTGEFETVPSSIEWAGDCTTEQTIYNYNCTKCGGGLPAKQLPVGHIWEYYATINPDCETGTNGVEIYVCANENCSGKGATDVDSTDVFYTEDDNGNAVKNVVIKAGHSYETVTVDATCKTQGYKYDVCVGCDAELAKNADDTDREILNGHYVYDVVAPVATAHVPVDLIITAATCTKTGLKDVVCAMDGCTVKIETNVVIPATGHTYDRTSTPDLGTTTATCTKPAVKAWTCTTCGQRAEEEYGNASGHSYTSYNVLPTCVGGLDGYTVSLCSKCQAPNPENSGKTNIVKFDKNNVAHHGVGIVEVRRVEGDCTNPTLVYYSCTACKDPVTQEAFKFSAYLEGTGEGHDFTDVEEVAATCVNDGTKAHKVCEVCKLVTLDGTNPATANDLKINKLTTDAKHKNLTYVAAVAATCTTDGNEAGYKCNDCGAFSNQAGTEDESFRVIKKFDHKLPTGDSAYGYDYTYEYYTRNASCTVWGYDFYECALCGDEKIVNYVPDFGGHTLSNEVEEVKATCTTTGVKAHKYCTVIGCDFVTIDGTTAATAEDLVIAKVAHVNADEIEFWGTCAEAEDEDFDFVCTVCGTVTPEHSYVVTKVPATCMEYSYELWVCKHCEDQFMTNKGFTYSDNHIAWGEWVVTEPATTVATGLKVRECACGHVEEVVIPALSGVEFEFSVENAVYAGAEFTNSGLIALSIKTKASDLDVWGIRLYVHYNTNLVSNAARADQKNSKFEDIQIAYDDANGVATVVAYASVTKTSNTTLDGEENLVTLYFRLDSDAAVGAEAWFEMDSYVEVIDKDNNLIAKTLAEDVCAEVEATLGFVNENDVIDLNDAKDMMFYITGEAAEDYCSAADIDLDGKISAADFALMQRYLLGVIDVEDLAEAYKGIEA